jgi:hypothetical protein
MATPFTDNFEAYSEGDIGGQGNWEYYSSSRGTFLVNTEKVKTGTKSVKATESASVDKFEDDTPIGNLEIWIYDDDLNGPGIKGDYSVGLYGWIDPWWVSYTGTIRFTITTDMKAQIYNANTGLWTDFETTIPFREWFKLSIEWNFTAGTYRARINNGTWSDYIALYTAVDPAIGIKGVQLDFSGPSPVGAIYFDDIAEITPSFIPTNPNIII